MSVEQDCPSIETEAPPPRQLMISRESFCRVRIPAIIGKYGDMPETFQTVFDEAMNSGSDEGLRTAFMILDRWRFANQPREKQVWEQAIFKENYERNLQEGRRNVAHPDWTADLIRPDNIDQVEWLKTISPIPPEGFTL